LDGVREFGYVAEGHGSLRNWVLILRGIVQINHAIAGVIRHKLAIAHAPFEGVKMGRCLGLYFFGCGDIANMSQPSGDTAA
jgi:hypothetical protein